MIFYMESIKSNNTGIRFIILCITLIPNLVLACCGNVRMSLIEALHTPGDNSAVFTIRVDSTYELYMQGNLSYGKVTEGFYGDIDNQIKLYTGGNSSAGGEYLIPGKSYFVFGYENNFGGYSAFVCDLFSVPVWDGIGYNMYGDRAYHLQVVQEWKAIFDSQYTGSKEYYLNGNLIASGFYKKGRPEGAWEYFIYDRKDNYRKYATISYRDGIKDGVATYYNVDKSVERQEGFSKGVLMSNESYRSGLTRYQMKRDGDIEIRKTYNDAGILVKEESYLHTNQKNISQLWLSTLKHGTFREWYDHGRLKTQKEYLYGKKVNTWTNHDSTGALLESKSWGNYIPPDKGIKWYMHDTYAVGDTVDGQLSGKVYVYNDTACVATYTFKNGILDGDVIRHYNQYSSYNKYRNGKLHFIQKSESNEGVLLNFRLFYDGVQGGSEMSYNQKGEKTTIKNYKNGLLHGLMVQYSPKGTLMYRIHLDKGRLHGLAQYYDSDGNFESSGNYEYGLKTGIWLEKKYDNVSKIWSIHEVKYTIVDADGRRQSLIEE